MHVVVFEQQPFEVFFIHVYFRLAYFHSLCFTWNPFVPMKALAEGHKKDSFYRLELGLLWLSLVTFSQLCIVHSSRVKVGWQLCVKIWWIPHYHWYKKIFPQKLDVIVVRNRDWSKVILRKVRLWFPRCSFCPLRQTLIIPNWDLYHVWLTAISILILYRKKFISSEEEKLQNRH